MLTFATSYVTVTRNELGGISMKRVTMQDIADELGFSRNSVSKAINNVPGLAEDTRKKILDKAVEMGYKHFSYMQDRSGGIRLARDIKKSRQIALLCGCAISPAHFAQQMLDQLKRDLSLWGYSLIAYRVEQKDLLCRSFPLAFDPAQVCAVICVEMFDRAYDEMICSLGVPVLFVDGPNKRAGNNLPADQLYMDNSTPIVRFVNDMLVRGKRRIGFIGDYEHCQSFYERYTAFRYAMLMANVPVEERFIIKTSNHEKLDNIFSALPDLPDIFIAANDFVADDAIYALRKVGKSVPEDVMFCGFDNSPNSRIMTPTLTTVHIHTRVMAVSAMHLLLTRIEQPDLDFRTVHTETELIYRDSTRQ